MTCTICLLLLLVAEAVFFTEIYTQGKKLNPLFRICIYHNIQMKKWAANPLVNIFITQVSEKLTTRTLLNQALLYN